MTGSRCAGDRGCCAPGVPVLSRHTRQHRRHHHRGLTRPANSKESSDEEQKDLGGGTVVVSLAVSVLAVLGVYAQDTGQAKYTVRVPNGLAFSEFKGYEGWQTVSISHNEKVMAVILANPVMINAYKSGIPGNGKPFPDGSQMAKIHS